MAKIISIILVNVFMSTLALAYQEGTFKCQSPVAGQPDDSYKIKTINLAGASLPYLEISRFFTSDKKVIETKISGIATHFISDGKEMLMLGAVQIHLENGVMKSCSP